MKYLLIPIEEIDERITDLKQDWEFEENKDLPNNMNPYLITSKIEELNSLKSKGEIVEIQTYDAFNYADLGYGDMFCITQRKYREEGYKLIKTIKQ